MYRAVYTETRFSSNCSMLDLEHFKALYDLADVVLGKDDCHTFQMAGSLP